MSLEFDTSVTASQIPEILVGGTLRPPQGLVMVAAAGNEADTAVAYPAHTTHVISVGATTPDGCQAVLERRARPKLVAPGGGSDAPNTDNPWTSRTATRGSTSRRSSSRRSPTGACALRPRGPEYEGTSMASPHVRRRGPADREQAARVASPANAVEARLEQTARDLGPRRLRHSLRVRARSARGRHGSLKTACGRPACRPPRVAGPPALIRGLPCTPAVSSSRPPARSPPRACSPHRPSPRA